MQFVCFLCLVNLFLIDGSSNSVMVQRSSVIVSGARVELNCSISENDSASWTYIAWNTSTVTDIYLGRGIVGSMRSRYKIDTRISGHHNLIIDSVDLAHAGRYQCTSTMQQSLMNDVQLTVLGSDPVFNENISAVQNDGKEQAHLTIWCNINYTGNSHPVFNWTKSNVQNNITARAIASNTSQALFTKTSSITEPLLHANDSGVTFQCRITFQWPKNSQGNVYEYTWNYTLYGPRNLSIIRYQDRLECYADGNPTPNYRWTDMETNISANGHVFVLNGTVTSDKDHTFQCTAANIFVAENINITIQAKDSGLTQKVSNFPITSLTIGGSLLFLLIIAIIVSCIVHRKRLKDDTNDRPDVALNTDLNSYDEIALSSNSSPNYILEGDRLTGRSDGRTIVDNVVYSEVWKPKGRSNGSSGGNPGENSRPLQTQTRKNLIGADGTEYAELSRVKPPVRKGEVPKPPAFSLVEVYASIDHNGRAPPPPPKL